MGVVIILISQHVNVLYSTYMLRIVLTIFRLVDLIFIRTPVGVVIILISQHVNMLYSILYLYVKDCPNYI